MSKLSPLWIAALMLAVAGCNSSSTAKKVDDKPAAPAKPALEKLVVEDTAPGKGPAAKKGDLLCMVYTGTLANGTQFDSNVGGMPFHLWLGGGEVIRGWDEGLVGLKAGGKRRLSIPWNMAYGEQAMGDKIPAKSDLYFDVELLALIPANEVSTVIVLSDKKGTGRAAKAGDVVTVKFVGTLPDGTKFDTTDEYGGKYSFTVGSGSIVSGFNAGVIGMQVGGKRKIRLPPAVGRNEMQAVTVPQNSILDFEIELTAIN